MHLISIRIDGLNGWPEPITADFHRDINILTGRNGAGKTTLLKSLWYVVSGNVEHLVREIPFDKYYLETSAYRVSIHKKREPKGDSGRDAPVITYELTAADGSQVFGPKTESLERPELRASGAINSINRLLVSQFRTSSVFFPTFRRIEGGFGIGESESTYLSARDYSPSNRMQEVLEGLSSSLSTPRHKFVASISTSDLKVLLNSRFAELSNRVNEDSNRLLARIFELIGANESTGPANSADALEASRKTLDDIKNAASQFEDKRKHTFAPFDVLLELVQSILAHRGIRLTETLVAGDAATAIDSTKLSAGEKQLLSFLCYNAFAASSSVFIDEPELSLHVDWQRVLVRTLASQQPDNQFFIATHSPFIYGQYSDKELQLRFDRGDTDAS